MAVHLRLWAFCSVTMRTRLDLVEGMSKMDTVTSPKGLSTFRGSGILLPVLLLLGAFVFAFCLGEAVHELGHYIAHRACGVDVGIRLDPFGGSRILHGASAPREIWGITSLAGPLFNLVVGLTFSLALWRRRCAALLPLLLWGPIALVQEGVTFSLGLLTPGGDAELIVNWGVPTFIVLGLGVLFLASGVVAICWMLPLVNLLPTDSLARKFGVVVGGMASFMVVRLLYALVRAPDLALENAVPLVFSLLLATIVVALYTLVHPVLSRVSEIEPVPVTWRGAMWSLTLGVGMVLFQVSTFN